jgi:hypothetical protein
MTPRMRMERGGAGTLRPRSMSDPLLVALALSVLMAGLAGCAKADPVAALKDRASTYWGLKQSKGWDEVYEKYLDPEAKKTITKEAFLKRRWLAFDILSYEISNVQETGDKAKVEVTNVDNFPIKTPQGELTFIKKQVTTNDEWVRRNGTWYVVLSE